MKSEFEPRKDVIPSPPGVKSSSIDTDKGEIVLRVRLINDVPPSQNDDILVDLARKFVQRVSELTRFKKLGN